MMNQWSILVPTKKSLLENIAVVGFTGLIGIAYGAISLTLDPSYEVAAAVGIAASVSLILGTWFSTYPWSLWIKGVDHIASYQRARADKLRNRVDVAMSQMGMRVPDESSSISPASLLFRVCLKVSVFLTLLGIQGGLVSALWIFIEINVGVANPGLYLGYLVWSISVFVIGFVVHLVIFADIEISTRLLERKFDRVMKDSFPVARAVARTNMIRDFYEATERFLSKVLNMGSGKAASTSTM